MEVGLAQPIINQFSNEGCRTVFLEVRSFLLIGITHDFNRRKINNNNILMIGISYGFRSEFR